MTEFDSIFTDTQKTKVDYLVEDVERDYAMERPEGGVKREREEEKKKLKEEIGELKKKLNGCRNVRNNRSVMVNGKMHEVREKVRGKIMKCEARLEVIDQEELGAKVDPVNIVKAHKEKQINSMVDGKAENISTWNDL